MTPGNAQFFAERVCLSGSDEEKIDKLVSKGLSFGQDCIHKPANRVGNVVSGTNNCTVGSGKGITSYNGKISSEGMQLRAKVKVLNAQGVMNEGAEERDVPTFEIRRTGNC